MRLRGLPEAEGTVPGCSRLVIRAASYLKEREGTVGL